MKAASTGRTVWRGQVDLEVQQQAPVSLNCRTLSRVLPLGAKKMGLPPGTLRMTVGEISLCEGLGGQS